MAQIVTHIGFDIHLCVLNCAAEKFCFCLVDSKCFHAHLEHALETFCSVCLHLCSCSKTIKFCLVCLAFIVNVLCMNLAVLDELAVRIYFVLEFFFRAGEPFLNDFTFFFVEFARIPVFVNCVLNQFKNCFHVLSYCV